MSPTPPIQAARWRHVLLVPPGGTRRSGGRPDHSTQLVTGGRLGPRPRLLPPPWVLSDSLSRERYSLPCPDVSHALVTPCTCGVLALLSSTAGGRLVALVSCCVVGCVAPPRSRPPRDGPRRAWHTARASPSSHGLEAVGSTVRPGGWGRGLAWGTPWDRPARTAGAPALSDTPRLHSGLRPQWRSGAPGSCPGPAVRVSVQLRPEGTSVCLSKGKES